MTWILVIHMLEEIHEAQNQANTADQVTVFKKTLHRCMSVKYLGVILDSRLIWKEHVDVKVKKAHNLMWACRRACGVVWGLRPKEVYWLYIAIIRPTVTFASLVWWAGCQTTSAKRKLSKVQRLACLGITGAMCTTPTNAVEALICLPHCSWWFRARLGQLRIDSGVWEVGLTYIPIEDIVVF
jgi:hypothetical protein